MATLQITECRLGIFQLYIYDERWEPVISVIRIRKSVQYRHGYKGIRYWNSRSCARDVVLEYSSSMFTMRCTMEAGDLGHQNTYMLRVMLLSKFHTIDGGFYQERSIKFAELVKSSRTSFEKDVLSKHSDILSRDSKYWGNVSREVAKWSKRVFK